MENTVNTPGRDVLKAAPGSVAEILSSSSMRKIRLLHLTFENQLDFNKLPALRAAITRLAVQPSEWLHHHLQEDKFLYRYPLIQLKLDQGNPSIWAVEEGAAEVLKIAEQAFPAEVKLYDEKTELRVNRLVLRQHVLRTWDKMFTYRITNWLALNTENYERYRHTPSLQDRIEILRRVLIAHIISFAEGVKWNVDSPIQLCINDIHACRSVRFKKVGLLAFDVTFTANVSLPTGVGLGKAVSVGFGKVERNKYMNNTTPVKSVSNAQH